MPFISSMPFMLFIIFPSIGIIPLPSAGLFYGLA
jgi:hypothetical protein